MGIQELELQEQRAFEVAERLADKALETGLAIDYLYAEDAFLWWQETVRVLKSSQEGGN